MAYMSPKWLVVEFLRSRLTDPRSRAESSTSDTFTATSGQKEFTLTPTSGKKVSCVTSVTDGGVTQSKNEDYYVDLKNNKVIFFDGRTAGNTIVVNYKEGASNWIYPDKPRLDISRTSFPRMSVTVVSNNNIRLGNYSAPLKHIIRFQVNIWVKEPTEDEVWTIDGSKYSGHDLAEYLAYEVIKALENYESDLHPALWGYDGRVGPQDMPFDYDLQLHQKVLEFTLMGIDVGQVNWK